MAKTKYTVVTPYGEFTRSTDRIYTHIVLVAGRPAGWLELRSKWTVDSNARQVAEYSKVVSGEKAPQSCSTVADYQRWLDGCQAALDAEPAKLEKALADNTQAISDKMFHCETWCGRYDLALKAANKLRKDYALVEIHAVDAQ